MVNLSFPFQKIPNIKAEEKRAEVKEGAREKDKENWRKSPEESRREKDISRKSAGVEKRRESF